MTHYKMMMSRVSPSRPSTPSFRIFDTVDVNPSPTFTDAHFEDEEELFEDILSPKKLRTITGETDLSQVTCIELHVDTSDSSLGFFGSYLPNLLQLRLSGSRISSVRDLGTSLKSLEVLWMCRCGLGDLDGISSIGSLKELYLSYNEIDDVSPLSMVDSLELVDLESNLIENLEQVEFLSMCGSLTTLNLEGNPITSSMSTPEYRKEVTLILPSLKVLDDLEVGARRGGGELGTTSHPLLGNTGSLISEIKVVQSSIREMINEDRSRPKSALSRAISPQSPPTTPQNHEVMSPGLSEDHSSDLTHGAVMCGPPSKMLTKMSRNAKENILERAMEKARSTSPPKLVSAWMEDGTNAEVIEEWKKDRDWLTRELTINHDKEIEEKITNQANYEATLADFPQQRKLHRPTSGRSSRYTSSPTSIYDEVIVVDDPRHRGEEHRHHNEQHQHYADEPHHHIEEEHHHGDEHYHHGEEQRHHGKEPRHHRDDSRTHGNHHRSNSRDRSNRESMESSGSSNSSMKSTRKIQRSPNIEKDSKPTRTCREKAGVSKSLDQPQIQKVRTITSHSLDNKSRNSPIKATFRPQEADVILERYHPQLELKRSLPTPPISPANASDHRGSVRVGGLSSRFRRLKVSVEDQVNHQATVDVMYSDKMPRPGISRHTMAVPRPGAQG